MRDMLTFEIDLNMLRGDQVRSHVEFMDRAGRLRPPQSGEDVWAVDEDGARYFAVLEKVWESGFVDLRVNLETRMPPVRVDFALSHPLASSGPDEMRWEAETDVARPLPNVTLTVAVA